MSEASTSRAAAAPSTSRIASNLSSSRKRSRAQDSSDGQPPKRRRTLGGVEAIDLSVETDEQAALELQRQTIIKKQQESDPDHDKSKRFGQMNCIICLDNFTNVATSACGHLFCHECLVQALIVGEMQSDRRTGGCPVCRKPLKRQSKGHVVPLVLMTKKTFELNARTEGQ